MEKEIKFLVYRSADENVSVNAIVRDESIWLTQKAMGELFGVDRSVVSKHLKNIFDEGELDEKVVCAKIALTTQHGAMADKTQTKETQFYNLDAIISVGYRVNSRRATRFRRQELSFGEGDTPTRAHSVRIFRLHRRPHRAGKHLHHGTVCPKR